MLKTIVSARPVNELPTFEDVIDRMLGNAFRVGPTEHNGGILPVDVFERENALVIRAAVPGIDPELLDIQVESNVLTIRGEVKSDIEEKETKVYRRETSFGKFSRAIRLPENLDLEAVAAEFKNGFVTITLPRQPEEKPKSLRIPVKA